LTKGHCYYCAVESKALKHVQGDGNEEGRKNESIL
jgi:hypothetical protein